MKRACRNAEARPELALMPRFYFHPYTNEEGGAPARPQFPNVDEACVHAVQRTPAVLGRIVRPRTDTYLSTAVSGGNRTICVVRGKGIIERH